MKKYVNNRAFLITFLLILVVGFLILPNISLAKEEISPEQIDQYLELPSGKSEALVYSLIQVFTDEIIYQWSAPYSTAQERVIPMILQKGAQVEALNHLLVDAPLSVGYKIIKGAVEIARVVLAEDISVIIKKLEQESAAKAVEAGEKWLFKKEIRVSPGTIDFEYTSYKGNLQKVLFQYIIIYKPLTKNKGKVAIKIYSPESIEPPKSTADIVIGTPHDLTHDLSPFIVEVQGTVQEGKYGGYDWIKGPFVEISFPEQVPDLGIRPQGFWEKHLLRPLKGRMRKVKVLVTRVAGKKTKFGQGIRSLGRKIKSLGQKIKAVGHKIRNAAIRAKNWAKRTAYKAKNFAQTAGHKVKTAAGRVWAGIKSGLSKLNPFGASVVETPESEKKEETKPEQKINQLESRIKELKQKMKPKQDSVSDTEKPTSAGLSRRQYHQLTTQLARLNTELEVMKREIAGLREVRQQQQEQQRGQISAVPRDGKGEPKPEQEPAPGPQKWCSVRDSEPAQNQVVINELAWMGTKNSATDEWIELKNASDSPIALAGWQLLDQDQQIAINFATGTIPGGNFYLLERTDDHSVPNISADLVYTGALNNSNELLFLFDDNCVLQDKIIANNGWPAGDNEQKRSMERNLGWHTYSGPEQNGILGTPNAENSKPKQQQQKQNEQQKQQEEEEQAEPQIKLCVPNSFSPTHSPLIINEVAWMGTADSYNNEWIELKNISDQEISLKGWQLLDQEQDLEIIFEDDTIPAQSFYLLERTDRETLPELTSDQIYTGALSNNDEALYLFNSNCTLIDKVSAAPDWPAGDNSSKKTMERTSGLEWQTSRYGGGTPSQTNSSGPITYSGGAGGGSVSSNQGDSGSESEPPQSEPTLYPVFINEVMYNLDGKDAGHEWIEVFNATNTELGLADWRLYENGTDHYIQGTSSIPGGGYAVIADDDQQFLEDHPDYSGVVFDSTFSLRNGTETLALKTQDLIVDEIQYSSQWGADGNGNSLQKLDPKASSTAENWAGAPPTPGQENKFLVNQNPIAAFDHSPKTPEIGEVIEFDSSSSTDPDGDIANYSWDFDDGSSTTTIASTTTHSYAATGTYAVSLMVADDDGATSSTSSLIQVIATSSEVASSATATASIVINEIAWMGTEHSSSDEWIEFYNSSSSEVNIADWSIFGADTGKCLNFSEANGSSTTTIAPGNYLIYANHQDDVQDNTSNSLVDIWDASIELNNTSPGQLILYNAMGCSTGTGKVVDIINKTGKEWLAGDSDKRITMERLNYNKDGRKADNWQSNNTVITNGRDAEGNPILGTPAEENSVLHISPAKGTQNDPYQIYDLVGLKAIVNKPEAVYALANDINASSTENEVFGGISHFNGTFDGRGYRLENLHVKGQGTFVGLFGKIGSRGSVKNLALTNENISALQWDQIGGLAGEAKEGAEISQCYTTGLVRGKNNVGGLVGNNHGTIKNSYSLATSTANGVFDLGGLVGFNDGSITDSYAVSKVKASSTVAHVGGLVGKNKAGSVTGSFWDAQFSNQEKSDAGIAKWTSGMKSKITFTNAGWDISTSSNTTWNIKPGTYPFLQVMNQQPASSTAPTQGSGLADDPYLIKDLQDLQDMKLDKKARYQLVNDIDASATHNWDQGFEPVGNDDSQFLGSLNGQGYLISDLFINRPGTAYIGLFGYLGPEAEVKSLGLVDVEIKGHQYVGGLAGKVIGSLINQCYTTGQVTASYGDAGGIAGWIDTEADQENIDGAQSKLSNCYSRASVTVNGTSHGGGFAGDLKNGAVVENSYSTGEVIGTTTKGFISNVWEGNCYGCIWNIESSGQLKDPCAASSTTAQMQTLDTFGSAGWDISTSSEATSTWGINEINDGYPFLKVFQK